MKGLYCTETNCLGELKKAWRYCPRCGEPATLEGIAKLGKLEERVRELEGPIHILIADRDNEWVSAISGDSCVEPSIRVANLVKQIEGDRYDLGYRAGLDHAARKADDAGHWHLGDAIRTLEPPE